MMHMIVGVLQFVLIRPCPPSYWPEAKLLDIPTKQPTLNHFLLKLHQTSENIALSDESKFW